MNYKLFAILALCITCLFSSSAYASALPKDDTPDGEIGNPNRIPKNPSTTPPGTVPPPSPTPPDLPTPPKKSPWDKVKKNIKKIGKPSLPDVAIWILGEGIDKVMDPKNNTAIKCDGDWMYHSVQGGIATKSGSYVEHAQAVFYDYVANQTRQNMRSKPFIEPNFRDGGKGYDRTDGNIERFVEYDTYDFWGNKTSVRLQVYKFCKAPDPKTDEPPTETEAPEGPDATPPQPNPDPNTDPNTEPKPNPDKEPNPRPNPDKDPNTEPKPNPDKEPNPNPNPNTDPNTEPKPNPDKEPNPRPNPDKDPNTEPKPNPDKEPNPDKNPDKDPNTEPKPNPDKEPNPDKNPGKDAQSQPFKLPEFCSWASKVCDFIDWVKQEPPEPEDPRQVSPANLSDLGINDDELFKQRINFSGQCPQHQLNFVVNGYQIMEPIPTHHFCNLLEQIAPWLLAFSYLSSGFFVIRSL